MDVDLKGQDLSSSKTVPSAIEERPLLGLRIPSVLCAEEALCYFCFAEKSRTALFSDCPD